ncbi:MAG: hypothetical protein ABI203_12050, partial [Mucilaginibacter sp.]
VAETLASNHIKLVPDILVNGKDGGSGGMIDALIGNDLLRKLQTEAVKEKDQPKKKEDGSEKRTE